VSRLPSTRQVRCRDIDELIGSLMGLRQKVAAAERKAKRRKTT
jgi:hypothetical protein